ncbi:hypothetical protein FRC17_001727 [Serendipita sp. 399]|nr:hypothetical protein FRC17_001727 [Serendipita sp. 399]
MFRAVHKIADHALFTAHNKKKSILGWSVTRSSLHSTAHFESTGIILVLQYVGYGVYIHFKGVPSPISLALVIALHPDLGHLFGLGLVSSSLSFGGAFTAIPFIQAEAVLRGGWLPQQDFLDCIAIENIVPSPLVIFATFVGLQRGNVYGGIGYAFAGAVLITIGMFFPCFLFVIAGHHLLERLVRNKFFAALFDGVCGSVVGVIAIVAFQLLSASINSSYSTPQQNQTQQQLQQRAGHDALAAVIFMLALAVLYKFTNKYTILVLVFLGAVAGQFLFV